MEQHKPYRQFLVRLCGIIGGIFVVSGKNAMIWTAPSKDSAQPGHQSSLIRVFVVHLMGRPGHLLASCG